MSDQPATWDPKHQRADTTVPRAEFKLTHTPRSKANISADSSACNAIADLNPPKTASASGLLPGTLDGEGEDGEDEDDVVEAAVKQDGKPTDGKCFFFLICWCIELTDPSRQEKETQGQQKEEIEGIREPADRSSEKTTRRSLPLPALSHGRDHRVRQHKRQPPTYHGRRNSSPSCNERNGQRVHTRLSQGR